MRITLRRIVYSRNQRDNEPVDNEPHMYLDLRHVLQRKNMTSLVLVYNDYLIYKNDAGCNPSYDLPKIQMINSYYNSILC